jgi:hypothetical protein
VSDTSLLSFSSKIHCLKCGFLFGPGRYGKGLCLVEVINTPSAASVQSQDDSYGICDGQEQVSPLLAV